MQVLKPYHFLFIFLSVVHLSYSKCRTTYMTFCDSFEDFKVKNVGERKWTEIFIGSDKSTPNETVLLEDLPWENWPNLKVFCVVNKIKKLEKTDHGSVINVNSLDSMVFYGNNFAHLESDHFRLIATKKLNLINNKIETIKPKTFFKFFKLEILDLSDNLLESIEINVLPRELTTLIIKNNRLYFIESGSLPSTLKHLDLSHNNLRHLPNEAIRNLKELRTLILSNNKIKQVPDLSFARNLYGFDMSHNSIVTIGATEVSQPFNLLEVVNLSHNNIEDSNVLSQICSQMNSSLYWSLQISLAFNSLSKLQLTGVEKSYKLKLNLYGNPWDCEWFNNEQRNFFKWQTECDLNYFASGLSPYCVSYENDRLSFRRSPNEIYQTKFYNIVNKKKNLFDCNLDLQDIV